MKRDIILKTKTFKEFRDYANSFYTMGVSKYNQKYRHKLNSLLFSYAIKDSMDTMSLHNVERLKPYFLLEGPGKSIPIFLLYKQFVEAYVVQIKWNLYAKKTLEKYGHAEFSRRV